MRREDAGNSRRRCPCSSRTFRECNDCMRSTTNPTHVCAPSLLQCSTMFYRYVFFFVATAPFFFPRWILFFRPLLLLEERALRSFADLLQRSSQRLILVENALVLLHLILSRSARPLLLLTLARALFERAPLSSRALAASAASRDAPSSL